MNPTTSAIPAVDPSTFGDYSDWAKENLAKGASAQDLQAQLKASNINPAAPQTGSNESWWQKLIPTAGSILGGIGGEVLGPIGGIGGAAAGGAAGKWIENKLTGKGDTEGVLSSAIEGGVGQGVGQAIGGVGKALLSKGSDVAETGVSKLVQGQFGKQLDKETAQTLAKMGITDARQVQEIAPLITQSNGALSTGVKQALAESADAGRGIDISGLDTTAKNILAEKGALPKTIDTVGANLTSATNNMVNPEDIVKAVTKKGLPTYSYSPGSLSNALPEDVFKQSQQMQKLASEAYGNAYDKTGSVINLQEKVKADAYTALARDLESRAFGVSSGTPLALSDNAKSAIIDKLAPVKDINPAVYNHYVDAVSNANTVQELRALQQPMVAGSTALDRLQALTANQGGISTGDIARGTIGVAKNPIAAAGGLALSSPGADAKVAGLLDKFSTAAGSKTAQTAVPLLSRIGAISATTLPNMASTGTTQPTNPALMAGQQQGVPGMNPTMGAGGLPNSSYNSIVDNIMQLATLNPNQYGGMASAVIPGAMPQLLKGQIANAGVNTALGGFGGAGGAQGAGGGLLSRLTGLIPGTAANTYQNEQQAAAAQLASALGISPQQAMAMLPGLMQSQPVAGQQIGGVQSILANLPGAAQ